MTYNDMPNYDPGAVAPMRDELVQVGFTELLEPSDVERELAKSQGTALVMINSVCGCAAGNARPGVALALQHDRIPDRLLTAFAGMEKGAVRRVREHFGAVEPSSPCLTLFKDGQPVWHLPRHEIETRTALDVAAQTVAAFDRYCERPGPSIPREAFEQLGFTATCGCSL
jgi:putative YphP/YqiW family bacilliredoxin